MARKATIADYIQLQGGRPQITQENGLWHIRHAYRDDEPEIVTHISPEKRGTVIINNIEFEVASLWQFEGEPCEQRSNSEGGHGYGRNGLKKG